MRKITFMEFEKVMSRDLTKKSDPCIEIHFGIDGCIEYQDAWITKVIDRYSDNDLYGFGLASDGSQEYNYYTFEEFANAKVFKGNKSLKELWDLVSIWSLDGGQIHETLPFFLNQP